MSWLFSRALVEACLPANCSETAQSAPSSLTPMPQAFSFDDRTTATYRRSRFGLTCAPLTADRGEALLTAFRAVFPARTSASPAPETVLTESAPGSGESSRAWFAKLNPDGSEWKTPQCSLLGDSESFSETWPRSGSMRSGTCYPRPTLAPSICVSESGSLLPTLTVKGNDNRPYPGKKSANGLATALRLLPTLCAVDTGAFFNKSASEGAANRPTLGAMAKHNLWPDQMLPTLAARDYRSPNAKTYAERGGGKKGEQLPNSVGGPLNPDWCEWFMGFPVGWTASSALETLKYHEWRQQHGPCSTPSSTEEEA